ncbi:hypothetical protein GCM10027568_26950 [Humibacter soli]
MDQDRIDDLPEVSISAFKVNPSAFMVSGAVVTNHGRRRAAFVPLDDEPRANAKLDEVKAQLALLSRTADPDDVARELAELSASRDAELIDPAR